MPFETDRPLRVDDLMVSWAQHGEDVVLARLFEGRTDGFYVDLGANHPIVDSVTKHFSLRGWRGVNVEPLQHLHQRLVEDRPRDINLNVAVSDAEGTLVLEEVEGAHGLSTATPELAQAHRAQGRRLFRREVPCLTLAALCAQHCGDTPIDFLKVDVEGHEAQVLRGGDWQRFRPRALVVESGFAPEGWHALLVEADYLLGLDDGLNRFYVRREDEAWLPKLACPANITDGFIRAGLAEEALLGREWRSLGPAVQGVARRLAQAKDASPQLKATLKRWLRY